MAISARDSLDAFKTAIHDGNIGPLKDMLADDFIFENTECEQDGKATILTRMAAGGFSVGDWVVYHEDDNVICGTHSLTPTGGPKVSMMYFAKFEAEKCVFWKVHLHEPA